MILYIHQSHAEKLSSCLKLTLDSKIFENCNHKYLFMRKVPLEFSTYAMKNKRLERFLFVCLTLTLLTGSFRDLLKSHSPDQEV